MEDDTMNDPNPYSKEDQEVADINNWYSCASGSTSTCSPSSCSISIASFMYSSSSDTDSVGKNTSDTDSLGECLVESDAVDGIMPFFLVRNFAKAIRQRVNPFKINHQLFKPTTPPKQGDDCSLPPPKNSADNCESGSQAENIEQSNRKEESFEITNTSPKSTLNVWQVLELPDPPKILSPSEAIAQVGGLIKPTPVYLISPEQLSPDVSHKQLQFRYYAEWCNAVLFQDIETKELYLLKQDTSHRSSKVIDKNLVVPPNSPELEPIEKIEEHMINPPFDPNFSTVEEKFHSKPLDRHTFSYTSIAPQEFRFKYPELLMNDFKRYNYVKVATRKNEATKSFDGKVESKFQPVVKEIPCNKVITVGEMQVSKFEIYDCVNLLIRVLDVLESEELNLGSEARAASEKNVEKNIMACIETLLSFSEYNFKRDRFQNRSIKGNIFDGAKEKYNALFDSKNKKAHKLLTKGLQCDLQKPLPIPIPGSIKNKSHTQESTHKNASTQVKSTDDIKNKPVPIPKMIMTKPKYPSPCPSPYPSPKFFGKFKGGFKRSIEGTKPNTDSELNEGENTTNKNEPQDKTKSSGKNHHSSKTTSGCVNNESFSENPDIRYNKTSLRTFSPKVSKRLEKSAMVPAVKMKFHDNSSSPYELPKSMVPIGTPKSLRTSNLSGTCLAIPSYGEVDIDTLSVNSITTVTDEIIFKDFTQQNDNLPAKQRATQISPLYWIQKHPATDVKEGSFRTLLKKVTKPFNKSQNVEKTNVSLKRFEVKPESVKNTQIGETKTLEREQGSSASGEEQISPSGENCPSNTSSLGNLMIRIKCPKVNPTGREIMV